MKFSNTLIVAARAIIPIFLLGIIGCAATGPGSSVNGEETKSSAPLLPWSSGNLKIGYVRSDVILEKFPDYKDVDNSLRSDNRNWLKQAEDMESEISVKETELEELRLILSPERRKQMESELAELRSSLQKFRLDTWYDDNSTYIKRRRELMEPVDARVNDAIWVVAEDEGLDIVFDTIAGNIVYARQGLDITDKVLEELLK